jgi:hypothetical protein
MDWNDGRLGTTRAIGVENKRKIKNNEAVAGGGECVRERERESEGNKHKIQSRSNKR